MGDEIEQPKRKLAPIAAKETGPGPGRYCLPSTCGYIKHDFTKYAKAAYSFGHRFDDFVSMKNAKVSPGPAYAINPQITKFGKDGTPAYSMLARQKMPNMAVTPAPGRYYPENVHPQREPIAPKYSVRARTRYRRVDYNPPANIYTLPPIIGARQPNKPSSAAYSIIGRNERGSYQEDLAKAPGPGRYKTTGQNVVKSQAPLYSMRQRSYMPDDNRTQKPGPGAHYPEKVTINKRQAPVHSLGVRHSEFICLPFGE